MNAPKHSIGFWIIIVLVFAGLAFFATDGWQIIRSVRYPNQAEKVSEQIMEIVQGIDRFQSTNGRSPHDQRELQTFLRSPAALVSPWNTPIEYVNFGSKYTLTARSTYPDWQTFRYDSKSSERRIERVTF